MTTITVVTAWRNHPELASDYFAAIDAAPLDPGDRVVIIDNASRPPLGHRYEANKQTTVTRRTANLGFAAGSNLGLRIAGSGPAPTDAVLFLNNDIVARRPGWLTEIRAALEPGYLVGPFRFDRHGDIDGAAHPYIDGWCLAGIRTDLDRLGGFDERLHEPAYFSDNDLCLRARASGLRLREVRPGLTHKTGTSTAHDDMNRAIAFNQPRFQHRGRQLMRLA